VAEAWQLGSLSSWAWR